ncbi:DNA polymerase III subunit alpha [Myxococcota bacterium]|nr:DNA polymerase III subunit alpha [Myxococcota bacterium]
MADRSFVHLHVHTQYSLLQATAGPKAVLKKAKELGQPAVAITDQGNLFGGVEFFKAAKDAGVHPVIGVEVYVAAGSRFDKSSKDHGNLVLLVRDAEGYRNVCKLVTAGYFDGFHYKPRIDFELLSQHAAGLIALSGCGRGEVARHVSRGDMRGAREVAERYAALFEKANPPSAAGGPSYYLEMQDTGWPDQRRVNAGLREIAREVGLPLVVSNHVHYVEQADAFPHEALLALGSQKTLDDEFRFRFPSDQFYMKPTDLMWALFEGDEEALRATAEIAERCRFKFDFSTYHFPVYPELKGKDPKEVLVSGAREGLERRLVQAKAAWRGEDWGSREAQYRERLEVELDCIEKMGFAAYFLIVANFIQWAKDHDIPVGPGRGSAAGSLVAWSLRITDIDPMPYDLLFERFLNPERVSMPDVDVDFCQDRREEVIRYVRDAYGGERRVSQIITFGKMLAKGVIRDVGRVLGLSFSEVDKIAKLIPGVLGMTLAQALVQEPRLRELKESDPKVHKLLEIALRLEGLNRHASIHAAGVVISDADLDEYCPLYKDAQGTVTTQFDMKSVESIGLIKFDFLGLKTLTQIAHALDGARAAGRTEYTFQSFNDVPVDDPGVYELLSRGDTLGVFQLESSGMRELLRKLKPSNFEDIIAVAALYRPGPLGSGMVDTFVECKHGRQKVSYPVPQLEPILAPTYGVVVYQEQVMQIAQRLASYSLGEADLLRRAMGKKKPEEMAKQKTRFLEGCAANGVAGAKAEEIFDLLAKFAEYGFNKSHTAAYALIAYQTAWLKSRLPAWFMASLLTIESANTDKVMLYINDCRERGIEVLPPDVNESALKFGVVDDARVRFGLTAVKGVGEGAIESILEARQKVGRFRTIDDFMENIDLRRCNRRVLEALIKCGAFDSLGYRRAALFEGLDKLMERANQAARDREVGQFSLFGGGAKAAAPQGGYRVPDVPEWPERKRLSLEKEALGFFITGHPMRSYAQEIKRYTTDTTETLADRSDRAEVAVAGMIGGLKETMTKGGDRMAFLTLEDMVGSVEVVVFPKTYAAHAAAVQTEVPVLVRATVDRGGSDEGVKLLAEEVRLLSDVQASRTQEVVLHLETREVDEARLLRLKEVLERHRGECATAVHLTSPGESRTLLRLPDSVRVQAVPALVEDTETLFGRKVVVFR